MPNKSGRDSANKAEQHRGINAEWHKAHKMPKNPTVAQRVAWHTEHAKSCRCREMTPKIREMIETHKAAAKPRRTCAAKKPAS